MLRMASQVSNSESNSDETNHSTQFTVALLPEWRWGKDCVALFYEHSTWNSLKEYSVLRFLNWAFFPPDQWVCKLCPNTSSRVKIDYWWRAQDVRKAQVMWVQPWCLSLKRQQLELNGWFSRPKVLGVFYVWCSVVTKNFKICQDK